MIKDDKNVKNKKMAVSKCPCLTFSAAMSCLEAKISLAPKHQLMVPSTLLAPATHIPTDKATKPQSHKATKIHTLTPLTYELFFQNSSIKLVVPCRKNEPLTIQIARCDTRFGQFNEDKLIK